MVTPSEIHHDRLTITDDPTRGLVVGRGAIGPRCHNRKRSGIVTFFDRHGLYLAADITLGAPRKGHVIKPGDNAIDRFGRTAKKRQLVRLLADPKRAG